MLPASLIKPLQAHLVRVKALHRDDLAEGYGAVRFASPSPWNASTPTPTGNGAGNTYLRIGCVSQIVS